MFATLLTLPLLMALLIMGARAGASVLPDDGQIAFGYASEGAHDIYLLDVRSGILRNLTSHIDQSLRVPVWSSDGSRLAMMIANGPPTQGSILVLDMSTGAASS
jgi:Tol biopolymer transport system component